MALSITVPIPLYKLRLQFYSILLFSERKIRFPLWLFYPFLVYWHTLINILYIFHLTNSSWCDILCLAPKRKISLVLTMVYCPLSPAERERFEKRLLMPQKWDIWSTASIMTLRTRIFRNWLTHSSISGRIPTLLAEQIDSFLAVAKLIYNDILKRT